MAKLNGSTFAVEPAEPPSTLTMETLLEADRQLRKMAPPARLFASPRAFDILAEKAQVDLQDSFVLGLRLMRAPEYLFRPPEKPLRSRPVRKWVRGSRKNLKAERPKLRRAYRVSSGIWKTRKVPDRRGYSQSTLFYFNPAAV